MRFLKQARLNQSVWEFYCFGDENVKKHKEVVSVKVKIVVVFVGEGIEIWTRLGRLLEQLTEFHFFHWVVVVGYLPHNKFIKWYIYFRKFSVSVLFYNKYEKSS